MNSHNTVSSDKITIFQADGNFGATAGIAELLVQSTGEWIRLLPALPDEWSDGKADGLCVRGGFVLDFSWEKKKIILLRVKSQYGKKCKLIYNDMNYEFNTEINKYYILGVDF